VTTTAPLLPVALAFAAGVGLGLAVVPPGWLVPAGLGLAVLLVAAARRGRPGVAGAGAVVLLLLAGWARTGLPDPLPPVSGLRPGTVPIEGVVTGEAETEGPRSLVPFLVTAIVTGDGAAPASGQLALHLYGPPPALVPGERARATVRLSAVRPFRNPGDAASRSQAREPPRILAVGRSDAVERLPDTGGPAPPWWLRVRLWIHAVIRRELPPVSGALLEGLVVGERRGLPPSLLADFRAAGVLHVLAISGFNVALVAGATFGALRLLAVPRRMAAALVLVTLAGFALVVGAQASVLRATVMGGLFLTAILLGRETGTWNSLAAALIGLLLLEPGSLADPGLQLSFAATAGLLHLGPPIRAWLACWLPRPVAAALAVSAGAQLAVTPLTAVHWSQVSLLGVVANLVVVPLAGALTVLGSAALCVASVSETASHLAFQSAWALLVALRLVVRAAAAVPDAVVPVPAPPPLAVVAVTAALVWAPWAARTGSRLAVGLMGALAVATTLAGALPDGRLHILTLDVGQGEAVLVRAPDGHTLLVDTGGGGPGRLDRGERVVLPALRRAGVRRLTALALTHGDPDHAGGLASVLGGLPVEEVWVPAGTAEAPWQAAVVESGVARRILGRGDRLWLGPVRLTVLHPSREEPGPPDHPARATNHGSLVLRVDWGRAALLLTGDAEAAAEREVLAAGLPVGASVLKVGHHGSRHASSAPFLAAVAPRIAVVSAGARNPFGHPSPAVLARLAQAGVAVYRTDVDGAVDVETDGERLWVRRWAFPTRPPDEITLDARSHPGAR
jgi:competence protein ComEC